MHENDLAQLGRNSHWEVEKAGLVRLPVDCAHEQVMGVRILLGVEGC